MKNLKTLFYFAIIITVAFASCERITDNKETLNNSNKELQENTMTLKKNFVYDVNFGELHNAVCSNIVKKINDKTTEIKIEDIDSIMLKEYPDFSINDLDELKILICKLKGKTFFEQQKKIDFSNICLEDTFYLKLDSIFNKYNETNFSINMTLLSELFNTISNSTLNNECKGKALSVVDVSRYSIKFWNNYQKNLSSESKFFSINDLIGAAKTDVAVAHTLIQGYFDMGYSWEAIVNNDGVVKRIGKASAYCSVADLLFDKWNYHYDF